MAQNARRRRHIGTIVRVCVACAAVGLLGVFWDWPAVFEALGRMQPVNLLLACLLFTAGGVFIGLRWYALLRAQRVDVGAGTCIRITYLGMFYNNVLVGSVGGDFLRMWYIAQHTHRRLEAVTSVLVDRALGLAVLVVIATVAWQYLPAGEGQGHWTLEVSPALGRALRNNWPWAVAMVGAAAGVIAVLAAWSRSRPVLLRACHAVGSRGGRFLASLRRYVHHPGSVLLGVALTLIAQSLSIVGFYLLGRSMGITLGLGYYYVFFPIGWVIGALPISVGGAGVVEGGLYWLFHDIGGVEEGASAALALCQRVVLLLGSTPGLFVHLTGGHLPDATEREQFFVDAEGPGR